jgi:hypothetical protein
MTVRGADIALSAVVKSRPCSGLMPSIEKNCQVTKRPLTRSAISPRLKVIVLLLYAAIWLKVECCCSSPRQSTTEKRHLLGGASA